MTERGAGMTPLLLVLGLLVVVIAIGWYFFAVALPDVPAWAKALVGAFVVVALILLALKDTG